MTESAVILGNSAFYYAAVLFLTSYSGLKSYIPVFLAGMLIGSFIIFYMAGNKSIPFSRIPYLIFTGIIISMILPWFLKTDSLLLFFAVFSIYLLILSRFSGDQLSIALSLGSMAVMVMIYFYQWGHEFLPSFFAENPVPEKQLFILGLISGISVVSAVYVNYKILGKLHITFSKKWFSRHTNRKIIKGILLFAVYLSPSGFIIMPQRY